MKKAITSVIYFWKCFSYDVIVKENYHNFAGSTTHAASWTLNLYTYTPAASTEPGQEGGFHVGSQPGWHRADKSSMSIEAAGTKPSKSGANESCYQHALNAMLLITRALYHATFSRPPQRIAHESPQSSCICTESTGQAQTRLQITSPTTSRCAPSDCRHPGSPSTPSDRTSFYSCPPPLFSTLFGLFTWMDLCRNSKKLFFGN